MYLFLNPTIELVQPVLEQPCKKDKCSAEKTSKTTYLEFYAKLKS